MALAVVATLVLCLAKSNSGWAVRSQHSFYYDVRSYGARGDGFVKDTSALQAAIDAAAKHGGGVVLVPPGRYLSGTLHLRSNVSIRLAGGATLIASKNSRDFDPREKPPAGSVSAAKITWTLPARLRRALVLVDRSPSVLKTIDDPDTTYAHYSLIVGDHVSNVTIDGSGTIDGNRTERGGLKLIALKNCRHITLRGVTLRNAASYNVSLIGTEDADLENLRIINGYADGVDPDDSRFVRIANCYIDTWDDAICAKASLALGRRLATEDLVVTNCILRTSNNGFKFGTESEGDLRNVTFSNSLVLRRSHGRAPITGVAIESVDGGAVDGVVISNVVMRGVRTPIFLRLGNRGRGMTVGYPGRMRDVTISDVVAVGAANPSSINGLPGFPIRDVTLANVDVQEAGGDRFVPRAVPELPQAYPQGEMFGVLPAYSLYARHVNGLTVSNWRDRCARKDARNAAIFDDVSDLQMRGFQAAGAGSRPVILLRNVDRALVESVSAGQPGALLLQALGTGSREIVVASGNEHRNGGNGLELFEAGK
jgi:polygalacturonase